MKLNIKKLFKRDPKEKCKVADKWLVVLKTGGKTWTKQ